MIAREAIVDFLILGKDKHPEEKLAAAREHYLRFCKSFTYRLTPFVRPSYQPVDIAWHYLTGMPHKGDWSPKCIPVLSEMASKCKTDIIWAGHTKAGKYLRVGRSLNCKKVLTTHNVESDLLKQRIRTGRSIERVRRWLHWRDVVNLEKQVVQQADVVTALTENDAKYYRTLKSEDHVFVLPFALPQQYLEKYEKLEYPIIESDICFIGTMDWPPNEDAACYLVNTIMPLIWKRNPEVNVYLVGKNPTPKIQKLASQQVTVTGRVKSVSAYLAGAKIVVAPMRLGSGIKIKVLEAMVAGKAMVTTSMGAQGAGIQHNIHALLADHPREFAESILFLLENEEKRSFLGNTARTYLLSEFEKGRKVVKRILNHLEFEIL
jgi:glycosyltransferase involved in cell wall biosynthesis